MPNGRIGGGANRIDTMKKYLAIIALLACPIATWASALGTTAKTVIPRDVQQLIVVDYRALNNSPTALALKNRVLPDPLKQFESNLRSVGVNPNNDVDQIVFASFKQKDGIRIVGIAEGQFSGPKLLARLKQKKIKGSVYRGATLYPMGGGFSMTLLDPQTLLFGDPEVVRTALNTRDDSSASFNANSKALEMMAPVQSEAIWSILDSNGTQTMLKSALGDASQLADYANVKTRLLGSRYGMRFDKGVNFDLDVITSDSFTAGTLSSLLKAGVMFRKATASPTEKVALDAMTVSSDNQLLKMKFATDDNKFESLLKSDLFASVSK